MREDSYWIAFHLIPEIGTARLGQLKAFFGSMESAWSANPSDLRAAGLPGNVVDHILSERRRINPAGEMERVQRLGARVLTLDHEEYPPLLRKIPDAPAVLYMQGRIDDADGLALAVIGTRKPTRYGCDATRMICGQVSGQGITIVSGLAQGIDAEAHRSALQAHGRTIAVLGSGIDRIYPAEHVNLARSIVEHGAVLSEFPLGTPPNARNFPRRNRILSGLSLAVLVVEAPLHSGALITVDAALEQGRDVFAVPANIFNQVGAGTNRLIQDGAKLVTCAQDILEELNLRHTRVQVRQQAERLTPDSPEEAKILSCLQADPVHIDDLIRLSGLTTEAVTATLTMLELKGLAESVGPMQYCRARPS